MEAPFGGQVLFLLQPSATRRLHPPSIADYYREWR